MSLQASASFLLGCPLSGRCRGVRCRVSKCVLSHPQTHVKDLRSRYGENGFFCFLPLGFRKVVLGAQCVADLFFFFFSSHLVGE